MCISHLDRRGRRRRPSYRSISMTARPSNPYAGRICSWCVWRLQAAARGNRRRDVLRGRRAQPCFYQATFFTAIFFCLFTIFCLIFFYSGLNPKMMWSIRPPELAAAESLKLALHESLRLQPNKLNHHPMGQSYKNSCEKYCATRASLTKSVAEL